MGDSGSTEFLRYSIDGCLLSIGVLLWDLARWIFGITKVKNEKETKRGNTHQTMSILR